MGAKKKGGAANRLAKMSDEDRAKYFQRKADAEEEARRRKEQLVATFMKNKLRKEDAFSRLNLAKINQQYHQTMRLGKCKEMKQDVEHFSQSIDRVVNLRNRTIGKLMGDLDWQENLYVKNLDAHTEHIANIIDFHDKQMGEMFDGYNGEKTWILHIGKKERVDFESKAGDDLDYIKTIIYGQDVTAKAVMKENHEFYVKQTDEMVTNYKTELSDMMKAENNTIYALWKQIAKILTDYIKRNDFRRSHLAELERLDVEGAATREKNEKQISDQLQEMEKLKQEYTELVEDRQDCIQQLQNVIKGKTEQLFKMRKVLQQEIALDDKRLRELASLSQSTIDGLNELTQKGTKIKALVEMCSKYESEEDRKEKCSKLKSQTEAAPPPRASSSSSSSTKSQKQLILRPKTGIVRTKPEIPIKIRPKKPSLQVELQQASPSPPPPVGFFSSSKTSLDLESSFDVLEKLEGLWWVYNKVKIDCLALKRQRRLLKHDNDCLKETVRGVLEDAALNRSIPSAKSSASTYPRKRFILSAPVYAS